MKIKINKTEVSILSGSFFIAGMIMPPIYPYLPFGIALTTLGLFGFAMLLGVALGFFKQ